MVNDMQWTTIKVVVAIVFNQAGEVLIAQRPADKPYAGYWEFPGGKVELGETASMALVRELAEELDINLKGCLFKHFMRGERDNLVLDFYTTQPHRVLNPRGLEGQIWRWVKIESLNEYCFPEPNSEVIARLQSK